MPGEQKQQFNFDEQEQIQILSSYGSGQDKIQSNISGKNSQSSKNYKGETKYRLGSNCKERRRIKSETWNYLEIKKIFKLYEQYGSQWKIIETEFVDRAANSIKNRFYTVIRTLLKILFREHPAIIQKLPHQIPSKLILLFFEGREEFARFKGLGKRILKMINYDLQSKQIKKIVQENDSEIIALYELIFDMKCPGKNNNLKSNQQINKCQSVGNLQQQQQEEIYNNRKSPKSTPIELCKTKTDLTQTVGDLIPSQYCQSNTYEGIIFFMPIPTIQNYFQNANMYPYYLSL